MAFARAATPSSERLRSRGLAVVHGRGFLDLARGDAHDVHGVADHVGRALLALGPVGILLPPTLFQASAQALNLLLDQGFYFLGLKNSCR